MADRIGARRQPLEEWLNMLRGPTITFVCFLSRFVAQPFGWLIAVGLVLRKSGFVARCGWISL